MNSQSYPYRIEPVTKNRLYDEICTSAEGTRFYINEFTYITVHKNTKSEVAKEQPQKQLMTTEVVEPDPQEEIPVEPEQPATSPAALKEEPGKARCANPSCSWPDDLCDIKAMTDYRGKHFCTLDCAEEYMGAKDNFDFAKGAFDGAWHKKYDKCRNCSTTERRHIAKGLCSRCYAVSRT